MEGLLIGEAKEGTFMNRRGEWGQHLPPKLEVVDPDDEFRPQEDKKPKRKPKNQSPASKDDPVNQHTKRQRQRTSRDEISGVEEKQTKAKLV